MHRQIAQTTTKGPLLEIGGGTLNHLPYEKTDFTYDVIEPFQNLFQDKEEKIRVHRFFRDICEIEPNARYNRIISIATLEHIENLPSCLAQAGLHLASEGVFQAGIPSEGGFLWNVSWRCSVGLSCYITSGLNYADLMKHEHLNSAPEIIALLKHFFRHVNVYRFPLPWHHASLYAYLEAREPYLDRCQELATPLTKAE
jgi:hypothetical protein